MSQNWAPLMDAFKGSRRHNCKQTHFVLLCVLACPLCKGKQIACAFIDHSPFLSDVLHEMNWHDAPPKASPPTLPSKQSLLRNPQIFFLIWAGKKRRKETNRGKPNKTRVGNPTKPEKLQKTLEKPGSTPDKNPTHGLGKTQKKKRPPHLGQCPALALHRPRAQLQHRECHTGRLWSPGDGGRRCPFGLKRRDFVAFCLRGIM